MDMRVSSCVVVVVAVACLAICASSATAAVIAGPVGQNPDPAPQPVNVLYQPGNPDMWILSFPFVHDPSAPQLIKYFESPWVQGDTGPLLVQISPSSAVPILVWEDFPINDGPPVTDWHEIILEPGWVWVIPGDVDPDYPGTEPTLITRNGDPWPETFLDRPTPQEIWVDFPPIFPGEILDVHKALLWVGTPENETWGDNLIFQGDQLVPYDENHIVVIEYPTPEPSSLALLALGGLLIARRRRG
jgi:hypothetical protein